MNSDDDKTITITVDDPMIGMANFSSTNLSYGLNGTSASMYYTSPSNYTNYTISSNNTVSNQLNVSGDACIEGSLKVNGVDIAEAIEKINKRLAILVPDPAKLEKFEALKRAYENYKTLEALCELPEDDE